MKRLMFVTVLIAVSAGVVSCRQARQSGPISPEIRVDFSPKGGCQQAVIDEIDAAAHSVRILAYVFTSEPIAKALLAAKKRGVAVEVVLDKGQSTKKYSSATFFHNVGIPVRIDAEHQIMHHKVMVIDDRTAITGSFNFTRVAEERNAENLLILRGYPEIVDRYAAEYAAHRAHAGTYEPAAASDP